VVVIKITRTLGDLKTLQVLLNFEENHVHVCMFISVDKYL